MNAHPAASLECKQLSIRGLANFVLDHADAMGIPVTNMALNKLVYFVVERLLVERGVLISNAKIEAWEHGPVFREIYQSFKTNAERPIEDRSKGFCKETVSMKTVRLDLNSKESDEVKRLIERYIGYSASQLRKLSHVEGGPWHQVWWHRGHANPGMEITPDVILTAYNGRG